MSAAGSGKQGVLNPFQAPGLDPRAGQPSEDLPPEQAPLLASQRSDDANNDPNNHVNDNDSKSNRDEGHFWDIERHHFWWLFGGIIFGDVIAFFDSTFMSSSHPVITSYFNASNSASWLSTVFFLTSTIFQPLAGRISDVVGRRPVYLFSILIFFSTTLWCALAQSIGSFILARAVCGLGAGGIITMSFVIVSDVVRIEYRGLYQSYLNLFYGIGHSLGAALGGVLCDRLGWRWAFGIQLPLIFICLLVACVTTPRDLGPTLMKSEGKGIMQAFKAFDMSGSVCLALAISGLILGLNLGGNVFPWQHPIVIVSLVMFVVSSGLLVLAERRARRPILPLPLLSTIPMANLMISNFLGSTVMIQCRGLPISPANKFQVTQTVLFNVPLFLQAVRQASPTQSGLYLISPLIGVTVTAVSTGFFITWSRRMKAPMVVGVLTILLGTSATACLSPSLPRWADFLMIPGASTGQGFLFPATSIAVLALSSQDDQAVVTTTLGLLRNLGTVLGVAVSSWVLQNALVMTLEKAVTGHDRDEIILRVRRSVRAIQTLDPLHKSQGRSGSRLDLFTTLTM